MPKIPSMYCPKCKGSLIVADTTTNPDEQEVYRKRKCQGCGHIFYTVEYEVIANEQFMKEFVKWRTAHTRESKLAKKRREK